MSTKMLSDRYAQMGKRWAGFISASCDRPANAKVKTKAKQVPKTASINSGAVFPSHKRPRESVGRRGRLRPLGLFVGKHGPAGDAAEQKRANGPGQKRRRTLSEVGDNEGTAREQRQRPLPTCPEVPQGDIQPRWYLQTIRHRHRIGDREFFENRHHNKATTKRLTPQEAAGFSLRNTWRRRYSPRRRRPN